MLSQHHTAVKGWYSAQSSKKVKGGMWLHVDHKALGGPLNKPDL